MALHQRVVGVEWHPILSELTMPSLLAEAAYKLDEDARNNSSIIGARSQYIPNPDSKPKRREGGSPFNTQVAGDEPGAVGRRPS